VLQPISAGIVAAITGFATSFAIVIAGLRAVGATDAQAASGLFALCIVVGVICCVLSFWLKIPISFAWSTPGAVLLVTAGAANDSYSFGSAVGAFIVCAVLIVLCGLWPALGRLITRIPRPIASAMLAGILFPICIVPAQTLFSAEWNLALPVVLTWLVLFRLAPRWAVPAAMLAAIIVIVITAKSGWLDGASLAPGLEFVPPAFDFSVILSIGLPLFIVTMAGQNVPGILVMKTFDYDVPSRAALVGSGAASAGAAVFGGHVINLAAITAALMASPEAHPDKDKRWIASFSAGVVYLVLGLGAGLATALVAAAPFELVVTVAGLAVLGALIGGITSALEEPQHRIVAILTFLVVASGVSVAGIGSAFWGLIVGGIVMLWLSWKPRRSAESAR
jgi:benzoate membrane transport protein